MRGGDLVGVGADLEPATLLEAYRNGLFPMPLSGAPGLPDDGLLGWWSPDPRGIIPLSGGFATPSGAPTPLSSGAWGPNGETWRWRATTPGRVGGLRVSRSLRKSLARFEVTVDTAFDTVITACADLRRPGDWISDEIRSAYVRMHQLGWAHSVEAWDTSGDLAGGLYGLAIGGLFAGESMFHRRRDASKVALVVLVELLRADRHPDRLLDVQWATPHLASLGAVEVSRRRYLELLDRALAVPPPAAFHPPGPNWRSNPGL